MSLCQLLSILLHPLFILGRDINSNIQPTIISNQQESKSPLSLNLFLTCLIEDDKPNKHWGKSEERGTYSQGNSYQLSLDNQRKIMDGC